MVGTAGVAAARWRLRIGRKRFRSREKRSDTFRYLVRTGNSKIGHWEVSGRSGRKGRSRRIYLAALLGLVFQLLACQADTGLRPLRSGVEGIVHFHGDLPPNTDRIVVVASYVFPPTGPADLAISDPLRLQGDSAAFRLVLPPGSYPIVGVLWKEQNQPYQVWNLLGAYFRNPEDFMPAPVEVPDRDTFVHLRIEADFSRAHPASQSAVAGTVSFHGTPPPDLEEVRLVAGSHFPPRNLLDLQIGPTVSPASPQVSYTFPLPPGEYAFLGLVAKLRGQSWDLNNFVALYTGDDPLSPGKVVVPDPSAVVQGIDLDADLSRVHGEMASGVRGVVRFLGPRPEGASKAVIVASKHYPPRSLLDISIGPTVDVSQDSAEFEMPLPPGDYELLGVIVLSGQGELGLSTLNGFYRSPDDSLRPGRFSIPDEHTWVGPFAINVDFNTGAIEGTVRFEGTWPENTEFVRVAAFDIIPQTQQDYYKVKGFTDPLPFGAAEAFYHLNLPPGTYRWIIVVWKAKGTSLFQMKHIGTYLDPQDPSRPGEVQVPPGGVVTGIDIVASFDSLGTETSHAFGRLTRLPELP